MYRATLRTSIVALSLLALGSLHAAAQEKREAETEIPMLGTPTMLSSDPTIEDTAETLELPETAVGETADFATEMSGTKCVIDLSAEEEAPAEGEGAAEAGEEKCVEMVDAAPMMVDSEGRVVPVGGDGPSTAAVVEQRLEERRLEIENMAAGVDAKQAILDAAEKRVQERAAALEELEKRVGDLVDSQQQAIVDQLKAMVAVYEGMKPKEAASIFDEMPHSVLVSLIRDMNPRKVAPILAKMDPETASDVTLHLAGLPSPTP